MFILLDVNKEDISFQDCFFRFKNLKASFVIVDIIDDKMIVNGDFVSDKNYEILPRELIVKNEVKLNLNNVNKIREVIKEKYIILNKIKLIIVVFGLILLVIILTILKKYFNYLKRDK